MLKLIHYIKCRASFSATLGFVFFFVFLCLAPKAQADITSNLVAHYTFDDGSGTTAADSVGNNTNDLTGSPTWTTGKIGTGAITLNGTSQYGVTANNMTFSGGAFTVSVWIKPNGAQSTFFRVLETTFATGWSINGTSDGSQLQFVINNGSNVTGGSLTSGTWELVTAVFDGSLLHLYINGSEVPNNASPTSFGPITVPMYFGTYFGSPGNNLFKGDMDDVCVYNRALSAQDVSDLYNSSVGCAAQSAPTISSVAVSTTTTTATITWTTNDAASSTVSYGLTSSYGSASTTDALVTSHQIILSGLSPGNLYHYQVASGNSNGVSTSSDLTFTTTADTAPPVISSIASTTAATTATVTWNTDEAATSKVAYGTVSGAYTLSSTSPSLVTSHSIGLSGLSNGTKYFYVVVSADSSGNIATSSEHTLLTETQDTNPPVISSIASTTSLTSATVTWTTDEAADSKVSYGTTSGMYTLSTSTATLTTSHSLSVSDLVASTTYYFVAVSTDASGNIATSSEQTFATVGTVRTLSFYKYEHAGNGTVTATVDGTQIIDCGSTCTASVPVGATITFTAVPVATSSLSRWEDCPDASGNTCTIAMPNWDMSMGAVFTSGGFTPLSTFSDIINYARANGGLTWVFSGDSFTTLNTYSAYFESYFQLRYPDINFHFRNMARGGSTIAFVIDDPNNNPHIDPTTGDQVGFNVDASFDSAMYGVHPDVVSVDFSDNGFPTPAQLQSDITTLITQYILPNHSTPVILGAWPQNVISAVTEGSNSEGWSNADDAAGLATGALTGSIWHEMAPMMKANLSSTTPVNLDGLEDDTDVEHLNEAATLAAASFALAKIGADGDVSSVTVDANAGTLVSEDHATTTNVTKNAYSGVDFTRLDQRLPMAFDDISRPIFEIDTYSPDLAINGSTTANGVLDMNRYMLTVENLPSGTYDVYIDGVDSATVDSSELASGWNMTTMTQGPIHDQLVEVLGRIRDKEGVSRTRLFQPVQRSDPDNACVPAGFNWWGSANYGSESTWYNDPGWRGDFLADVKLADAKTELACLDNLIHTEAQPVAHTFSIRLVADTAAPVISSIATSTTGTTATITWTTDENASSTVLYGLTSSYGNASTSAALVTSHSLTITGLTGSTVYHFQIGSADSSGNVATSTDQTFTTTADSGSAPSVTTSTAGTVSTSTAILNGSISDAHGFDATQSGFAYGTSADLSSVIATSTLGSQTGTASFQSNLTNLTPDTTYYYRAYATNIQGTGFGTIQSFTTSAISRPTVTTQAATSLGVTTVAGNGTIVSTGNVNPTIRGFVYGTTVAYGATTTESGDFGAGSFTASITGLTCGTAYHYAAYASSTQGIGYGSDVTFTPACLASLSGIAASSNSTGATITWTSDQAASSKVDLGIDNTYGSSTPEFDTSLRVTSHSVTIAPLLACTTYHYRVRSKDADNTEVISSDNTLTTSSCTASAPVATTTDAVITTTSSGTLDARDGAGLGLTLDVPAAYSSTTASASFQAKRLDAGTFFSGVTKPSDLTLVGNYLYNLEALTGLTTDTHSFDQPLTVSITYSDSDVANFDANTLSIKRYDGSTWNDLSNCSIDTTTKTVTCETSSFSDFGLFGTPISPPSNSSGSSSSSGSGGGWNPYLLGALQAQLPGCPVGFICTLISPAQSVSTATTPTAVTPTSSPLSLAHVFTRNLYFGLAGNDVKQLQIFLNLHGFTVAQAGAGSKGHETTFYGPATEAAIKRFQQTYAKEILYSNGFTRPTGIFGAITRAKVIQISSGQ